MKKKTAENTDSGKTERIISGQPWPSGSDIKNKIIRRGLVVWYSQTGNTRRTGLAIAAAWRKSGLEVNYGDYREINSESIDKYDIIAVGTPVYYYEVPENFRKWINGINRIDGIPVAAFVTFGGDGGNQHNTVCELAGLMKEKGGIPAGTAGFSCMLSWSLTWPFVSTEHLLKYSSRPDAGTFSAAEKFAGDVLSKAEHGETSELLKKFDIRNMIKGSPSVGFTKLLITGHRVNREKCTGCGICRRACPVNAINPEKGIADTGRCIACLGCINNCPVSAVEMNFAGKKISGYHEFIIRNNIKVNEPLI